MAAQPNRRPGDAHRGAGNGMTAQQRLRMGLSTRWWIWVPGWTAPKGPFATGQRSLIEAKVWLRRWLREEEQRQGWNLPKGTRIWRDGDPEPVLDIWADRFLAVCDAAAEAANCKETARFDLTRRLVEDPAYRSNCITRIALPEDVAAWDFDAVLDAQEFFIRPPWDGRIGSR